MLVNNSNLGGLFTGYNMAFQQGLGQAEDSWRRVATEVPSTTEEEGYPWLNDIPGLRKWIGDRHVHNLTVGGYKIRNEDFEDTVAVDTNKINDDTYGSLATRFRMMGQSLAAFPNEWVYATLAAGFLAQGQDGQYFFDTDHKVLDKDGMPQSVSNSGGGVGSPWFLLDERKPIRPVIYQIRQQGVFKELTPRELVERDRKIEYGCHHRAGFGYGFWQTAFGSKQTLDAANYEAARAAMMAYTGDYGRKLGVMPNLLVCGPSNEAKARAVLLAEKVNGGDDNIWRNTAELLVTPWLP